MQEYPYFKVISMKWIRVSDVQINGLLVHEIKCPVCKHKETYHFDYPKSCYVCDTPLEEIEDD